MLQQNLHIVTTKNQHNLVNIYFFFNTCLNSNIYKNYEPLIKDVYLQIKKSLEMLVFKEAWWKSYYKQNIKTTKPIYYLHK